MCFLVLEFLFDSFQNCLSLFIVSCSLPKISSSAFISFSIVSTVTLQTLITLIFRVHMDLFLFVVSVDSHNAFFSLVLDIIFDSMSDRSIWGNSLRPRMIPSSKKDYFSNRYLEAPTIQNYLNSVSELEIFWATQMIQSQGAVCVSGLNFFSFALFLNYNQPSNVSLSCLPWRACL